MPSATGEQILGFLLSGVAFLGVAVLFLKAVVLIRDLWRKPISEEYVHRQEFTTIVVAVQELKDDSSKLWDKLDNLSKQVEKDSGEVKEYVRQRVHDVINGMNAVGLKVEVYNNSLSKDVAVLKELMNLEFNRRRHFSDGKELDG